MTQDNIDSDATGAPNSPEGVRPFFIPPGVEWDVLPEELQQAISALVNPAYEQFVLAADDGLERASGLNRRGERR